MKFKLARFIGRGLACLVFATVSTVESAAAPADVEPLPGRPLDQGNSSKAWFPLTEVGLSFRINPKKKGVNVDGVEFERNDQARLTADVGVMKNLSPSAAVGGGVFAIGHDDGGSLGVRGRYRRWRTPEESIDYSLGFSVVSASEFDNSLPFMPVVGVTYSFRDQFLLNAQAEMTQFEHEGTDVALCIGGSLGSKPGAIVTAVIVVAGAIGLAIAVGTMSGL